MRKTMPFGKYKGIELVEIPPHYLRWLLRNVKMGFSLRQEVIFALGIDENEIKPQKQATTRVVWESPTPPGFYLPDTSGICPFDA